MFDAVSTIVQPYNGGDCFLKILWEVEYYAITNTSS